jgi:signal recognition particle receptor subunit beta
MTMIAASSDLAVDHEDVTSKDADAGTREPDDVTVIDHTFKILVTGPFAAGKTSLIQSVSQTNVVSTDVVTSGDESDVKGETTVAMDFGTYRLLDEGVQLLLFGTPGQPRFRFMTNILKGEVDIVAFVIDAQARHTHAAAGVELRSLLSDLRVPAVIAVNRCDEMEQAQRIARSLGALAGEAVVPCQLVDSDSGRDVIIEILMTLLDSLEDPAADVDAAWTTGAR